MARKLLRRHVDLFATFRKLSSTSRRNFDATQFRDSNILLKL